jgi:hypothetical protein
MPGKITDRLLFPKVSRLDRCVTHFPPLDVPFSHFGREPELTSIARSWMIHRMDDGFRADSELPGKGESDMDGGERESVDVQPPFALSMIICDAVHLDPGTGKAYILGCFGSVGADRFPASHPSMTVFAEVTECRGKMPFLVRVIDVDERQEPVAEAETELNTPDPLAITMLVLRLEEMVFPEPGEYRVQLVSGDVPLMERRLSLVLNPEEPNG